MKKNITLTFSIMAGSLLFGQVGINTSSPQTTLDIVGKKGPTDKDGLTAPRLTRAELTAKGDALYTASQDGTIIYITDISGGNNTNQRVNILQTGYYYFDSTANVWQKITSKNEVTGLEPWQITGTTTKATANTQNIYQNGNVAIGDYSATAATEKFDVNGNARVRQMPDSDPINYQYKVVAKSDGTLGRQKDITGSVKFVTGAFENLDLTNATRADLKDIYFFSHGATITLPKASNDLVGVELTFFISGGAVDSFTTGLTQEFSVSRPATDIAANGILGDFTNTSPYNNLITSWNDSKVTFVNNRSRIFRTLNFKLVSNGQGVYRWMFWASGV
ncbi:hypothetical protein [Chryseobacterium aureum]|uniref:hypothetical protein n=1 Tax=Chryseobacterium aureum TaxID=2497456 RepID=UPI000F865836|nr:hypothetical protein [Chryseobacterium aureum]